MNYKQLLILLPCHGLEDFPLYPVGPEAEGLLGAWISLWHPALVASAQAMPSWHPVDDPLPEYDGRLIVIPQVSQRELAAETIVNARQKGACVIEGLEHPDAILQAALAPLAEADRFDQELVEDFFALGYCYLEIELLTRQMRYSSNLDQQYFGQQLVNAAQAAASGASQEARDYVSKCFDVLAQERDHYYAVDVYVVDLALIAPTTMAAALGTELSHDGPVNLMLPALVLRRIADENPEVLSRLRGALGSEKCCCVAGPTKELPTPLVSCETILLQLKEGVQLYEQLLRHRPTIYGRRRFGLTPVLPQILHKMGFTGALHATLDDGRFPESNQAKTRWEGVDGSAIDTVARVPLDATRPETYLNLAAKIGQSIESDYMATILLAHWSGQSSRWFDLLRRCAKYTSALGKLTTLQQFLDQSDHVGHLDHFKVDQYHSPYLRQAVDGDQNDPISRFVRYWHRHLVLQSHQSLTTWCHLLGGPDLQTALPQGADVDALTDHPTAPGGAGVDRDESAVRLAAGYADGARALARRLAPAGADQRTSHLIVNPHSFVRRVGLELPEEAPLPEAGKPIYAVASSEGRRFVVADVPPTGFVVLDGKENPILNQSPGLAEGNVLRNEFFEAHVDSATGALRSIYDYHSRGNRLSQQLALRMPEASSADRPKASESTTSYAVMVADSVEVTLSNPATGQITSRGRLVDEHGRPLATFAQSVRIWRGSRVLSLEVELDPTELAGPDPWNSYYACRFAWPDESAELSRSVNLTRQPTSANRLEAPLFIDIDNQNTRTTILTAGLPYHRRVGLRRLDSLLVVRGETCRQFRLGIGVDVRQSLHEALGFIAPPALIPVDCPPFGGSGWLFHLDNRSVIATSWEPLVDDPPESGKTTDPAPPGFRVRLLETIGRSARVTLSAWRPILRAREVDFQGKTLADCRVSDGKIQLDMSRYQWSQIEAQW